MPQRLRYEILHGLPPYGPMYINIPENGYHSGECFVVRIYKADETSWVGNFGFGFGGISDVYDFPSHNRLVVFSRGGNSYNNKKGKRSDANYLRIKENAENRSLHIASVMGKD